ncbi:MAG TPA: hypothetical protein VFA98_07325 [Thermoanaerobaculia bacterium]|nr:hypothetical protein [Thermoanaerobaculia bacterium]
MSKVLGPILARRPASTVVLWSILAAVATPARGAEPAKPAPPVPHFSQAVAFDVSLPLSTMAWRAPLRRIPYGQTRLEEIRPERGPVAKDTGYGGDGALQTSVVRPTFAAASIPGTLANFEGLSQQDNFDTLGFRVNPPDPNGAVGPDHFVEMVNLTFGVFDKTGNLLLGPTPIGTLWQGFSVPDCTDEEGDPVVLYDRLENRWILSQFALRDPYYNCVAVSMTSDPTGPYFRYAFLTNEPDGVPAFPDYPKYGNWKKSYVLTSRDFGDDGSYGISIYALEKNRMIAGDPNARAVHFFLDSAAVGLNLVGDGLLPADYDGTRLPSEDARIPIVGTQDDGAGYGGTIDALNIWELTIKWQAHPIASITLAAQLPTAAFDSIFPCGVVPGSQPPSSRDCLPEPGITDGSRFLDILSYRQRPTFRLAYRNFGNYEALVTNQSVEALPGVAGVRWYEIRRVNGTYSIYQQGTFVPNDGVHRWMGSIAQDANGDMAVGYSVVNGTDVFPGIRYTGRMFGDPLGQMTLGEGTIIDGTGVQTTTNSRWGDYTDMNIDPSDDCTFWYVNEYYTVEGQATSTAGWQTRIGSFKFPGCVSR